MDSTQHGHWAPQGGEGHYQPPPEAGEPAPCCSLFPEDTSGLHLRRSVTGMIVMCLAGLVQLVMGIMIIAEKEKDKFLFSLVAVATISLAITIFSMAAPELMARYRRSITFTLGILSALLMGFAIVMGKKAVGDDSAFVAFLSLILALSQLPLYLHNVTPRGDCCCRWFCTPSYDDVEEPVDPYQFGGGGWHPPVAAHAYGEQEVQQEGAGEPQQPAQE